MNEFTIEHTQPSEAGRDPTSVSSNRIPYPLPKELQQVHMEYETGVHKYPESMVPLNATTVCPHGNTWDDRCPMTHQWVANKGVWIYKESTAFYSKKSTGIVAMPRLHSVKNSPFPSAWCTGREQATKVTKCVGESSIS